jgi:hypothetical protein
MQCYVADGRKERMAARAIRMGDRYGEIHINFHAGKQKNLDIWAYVGG